jgi:hypothetical protein
MDDDEIRDRAMEELERRSQVTANVKPLIRRIARRKRPTDKEVPPAPTLPEGTSTARRASAGGQATATS